MPESSNNFTTMLLVISLLLVVSMWLPRRRKNGGGRGLGFGRGRSNKLEAQAQQAPAVSDPGKNSKSNDLYDVLAQMIRFARRRHIKIVYPGYVRWQDEKSLPAAIFVGPFGLLTLHCYGYGGRVGQAAHGYDWQQSMNGQTRSITNPVQAMDKDSRLLRQALADAGVEDVPIYSVSVYTQPQVNLKAPAGCNVFDRKGLKAWLDDTDILSRNAGVNMDDLTETLTKLVKDCLAQEKAEQEKKKQEEEQTAAQEKAAGQATHGENTEKNSSEDSANGKK